MNGNYYEILGVSRDATIEEIRSKYRKLLLEVMHVDPMYGRIP